jgi:hypothetical protein
MLILLDCNGAVAVQVFLQQREAVAVSASFSGPLAFAD